MIFAMVAVTRWSNLSVLITGNSYNTHTYIPKSLQNSKNHPMAILTGKKQQQEKYYFCVTFVQNNSQWVYSTTKPLRIHTDNWWRVIKTHRFKTKKEQKLVSKWGKDYFSVVLNKKNWKSTPKNHKITKNQYR